MASVRSVRDDYTVSKKENTVPVYTRLPVEVADRLEKVATASDRTMAAEVRRAVREYLGRVEVSAAA